MYTILMLVAVATMAVADVSHLGYQYKVPHTSYGVPNYQSTNNGGFSSGSSGSPNYQTYQGADFGSQQHNSGKLGYHGNSYAQSSANQESGFGHQNGGSGHHHGSSFGQQTAGSQAGYQGAGYGQQHFGNSGYQVSGVSSGSATGYQSFGSGAGFTGGYQASSQSHAGASAYTVHQQPAQVFKHVYVHEAPEEPELPRPRQQLVLPAPQKHYKIIFIKAPTSTVYAPKYIPVPQQNEEKTIVYLLTKKSEELHDEVVPQIEVKAPAKPEVFFVKYQNKEDSQDVINNIIQEHNKGGVVHTAGAGFDDGLGGHYSQNGGSGQFASQHGSSTQFSQQGGSGAGGPGTIFVQNDGTSGLYGHGGQSHGQSSSSSYSTTQQYSQTSSPVSEHVTATPAASYGSPGFDGTVDTVVSTSQGLPHTTSYSNFRE